MNDKPSAWPPLDGEKVVQMVRSVATVMRSDGFTPIEGAGVGTSITLTYYSRAAFGDFAETQASMRRFADLLLKAASCGTADEMHTFLADVSRLHFFALAGAPRVD